MQGLSKFLRSTFLVAISSSLSAASSVTASRLPGGCGAYPAYNNSTRVAGPWAVIADSPETAVHGLRVGLEGFFWDKDDTFGFGIAIKTASSFTQNITLRCANETLQAQQNNTWVNLLVSTDSWERSLSWGVAGSAVEPYAHFINGTKQRGVYLGASNSTTWKFKYNWAGVAGEYYLLRLLGAGDDTSAVKKRQDIPIGGDQDYEGYLRVVE